MIRGGPSFLYLQQIALWVNKETLIAEKVILYYKEGNEVSYEVKSYKMDPELDEAHILKGKLHFINGRYRQARDCWQPVDADELRLLKDFTEKISRIGLP